LRNLLAEPRKILNAGGRWRGSVIVVALRLPPFGQLLCPIEHALPHFGRFAPQGGSSLRRIFDRPAAAPYLSATRKCPSAYPMILPPLWLRHYIKVDPAGSCAEASGLPPRSTDGHMAEVAPRTRPKTFCPGISGRGDRRRDKSGLYLALTMQSVSIKARRQ
jgi:hypothetical protein